ncbi:hypothetical protein M5W83_23040 [Paenibacillus thiaminolyticus]|uniref:Lipoprotein n=1 Tax=Paenibacillus thiaminolyticus TaxID=49283 RepID=A0AAP9DVB3_PANTH|nr:hypothetical protein [Paenibacillus thiaminolyticus]MCY9535428.1 hypothetical protein [Paenibacillus thiaminolyticus]MCY9604850.1 hypothetical protein [Paenibacillus thiaminolyticus]MCY9610037.1 hypothetical protein [Paenibacillus thiaminolyticus]MCY9615124.1 hypothetical protein [Paenibacillus thiaminolyticus]MCY9621117.1 hypothetical protein [Paenibacillus thiaminolyticus]
MKKSKIIVLFVLLVSMISGCTENRDKEMDVKSMHGVEDSLEELLTTTANLKYGGNTKNIRVVDVNVSEKSCFVTFLFEKDSVNWHAVMYAEKMPDDNYELGFLDGTKLTNHDPISIYNMVSETIYDNIKKRIHVVTGSINDHRVNTIYISYPNGEVSGIKVGRNQTIYTEIAIGIEGYPASVTAVSDNGEVLFEKKY